MGSKYLTFVSFLSFGLLVSGCETTNPRPQMDLSAPLASLNSSKQVSPLYAHVIALLEQGEYKKASSIVNQALQKEPRNSAMHSFNGLIYEKLAETGDPAGYELAAVGYQNAITTNPANVFALVQLGKVSFKEKKYEKAQEHFANALLITPEDANLWHELAAASYYSYDLRSAVAAISKAEKLKPNDALINRSATLIYAAAGEFDKAKERFAFFKSKVGNDKAAIAHVQTRLNDWSNLYTSGRIIPAAATPSSSASISTTPLPDDAVKGATSTVSTESSTDSSSTADSTSDSADSSKTTVDPKDTPDSPTGSSSTDSSSTSDTSSTSDSTDDSKPTDATPSSGDDSTTGDSSTSGTDSTATSGDDSEASSSEASPSKSSEEATPKATDATAKSSDANTVRPTNRKMKAVHKEAEDQHVVIDCYLLRVTENVETTKGHNILENLAVTFNPGGYTTFLGNLKGSGVTKPQPGQGTSNVSYTADSGFKPNQLPQAGATPGTFTPSVSTFSLANAGSFSGRIFTAGITWAGLTYNLNIANAITGRTRVISRPTLSAFLNKKTSFFAGDELVAGFSGQFGGSLVKYQFGVTVNVTPIKLEGDLITMDIEVEGSLIQSPELDLQKTLDVGKATVNTTVKMRLGETFLLGGLYESIEVDLKSGFPGLQDIPLLQYFFSREATQSSRRTVMAMLTPRSPQAVRAAAVRAAQRGAFRPHMDELATRNHDWFNPWPNMIGILNSFSHDPSLYFEFRTGDILPPSWGWETSLHDKLESLKSFLYY